MQHHEELLALRDPDRDPLGTARVLANQGTALAHLGIADHARSTLAVAQGLFWAGGDDAAAEALGATLVELDAVRVLAAPS